MVSLEQEKRERIAPFLFPALPLLNLLRRDTTVTVTKKRILIVDDDPDIRQVLSDRMSSWGYAVETANDGREALEALKKSGFDGMLLDMRMPEIDGTEVLRRTRESHPALSVVVVTATSVKESAAQAVAGGACAYLIKPFDAAQLKQTVEQCFGPAA
jgi:CheY-like chemotaxis protein